MNAINTPFSTAGQKLQAMMTGVKHFSTGGQVQAATDMGSITLNIGNSDFPMQGKPECWNN